MKKVIMIFILVIIILISGLTTYKVIKKHNDNLLKVSEKRIIEKAQQCWNDKVCLDDTVTLEILYQNNYLKEEINPLTKEIYNKKSYVKRKENTYEFVVVS